MLPVHVQHLSVPQAIVCKCMCSIYIGSMISTGGQMLSEHIVVTSAQKLLQVQRISAKCQILSGHIIITSAQKSLHAREKKRRE
jgi:hypothetical protein